MFTVLSPQLSPNSKSFFFFHHPPAILCYCFLLDMSEETTCEENQSVFYCCFFKTGSHYHKPPAPAFHGPDMTGVYHPDQLFQGGSYYLVHADLRLSPSVSGVAGINGTSYVPVCKVGQEANLGLPCCPGLRPMSHQSMSLWQGPLVSFQNVSQFRYV